MQQQRDDLRSTFCRVLFLRPDGVFVVPAKRVAAPFRSRFESAAHGALQRAPVKSDLAINFGAAANVIDVNSSAASYRNCLLADAH